MTVDMPDSRPPESETDREAGIPTSLTCLAIIGRLLGSDLTVADLVRDNPVSPDGATPDEIARIARRAGFQCKILRISFDGLTEAEPSLPGIVRFRDGSAMVLREIRRDDGMPSVVLQDPNAEGEVPLVLDRLRFEHAWAGDLLLLRRRRGTPADERPFDWRLVRRLVLREHGFARDLVLSSLALGFLALVPIVTVQLFAQRVMVYQTMSTLLVLLIGFVVLMGVETAFGVLRRYIVGRLSTRAEARLATALFDRLLALPVSVVERLPRGMLAFRVQQLGQLRMAMTGDLLGSVLDLCTLIFLLPLMAYFTPLLTVLVVLGAAVVGAGVVFALPRYHARVGAVLEAEERRAAFLSQSIVGAKTIKSLALGNGQRQRQRRLSDDVAARRLDLGRLSSRIDGLVAVVDRTMLVGTLAVGVYLSTLAGNAAAVSAIIAFYLLVQRLCAPLAGLSRLMQGFEETRRAITALGVLLDQPGSEPRAATPVPGPFRGAIAFSDVTFRYPNAAHRALRGVTFDCPAGTFLGIMGRSGSGKSTLARLLMRLYAEHRGTITLDGIDIRDIDTAALRQTIGVVEQDSFIFSGTIRENITAAKADASFEEMTRAARLSGADEFIDRLPRGFETVIQEGSPNLSAGQRQRLALARTLITNPRVLILDEALSALDGEIETRVLQNLRQLAGERTILLVSHRLTSLMAADRILLLDEGVVRDVGQHHDLLESSELYSRQWHRERGKPDAEGPGERLLALS